MKKFSIVLIIFLLCFGVACRRLPDPELNQNKPGFGYSERWKCFEDRFKRSDISDEDDPVFLSMYFFWFTGAYNEVYTREKKTVYILFIDFKGSHMFSDAGIHVADIPLGEFLQAKVQQRLGVIDVPKLDTFDIFPIVLINIKRFQPFFFVSSYCRL